MTITQPTTMITDYVLAAAGAVFGAALLNNARLRKRKDVVLWGIGFLVAAVAALTGGTYHGFTLYLAEGLRRGLWNVTVGLIGLSGGFMISAGISHTARPSGRDKPWLKAGLLVTLFGVAVQL